jgi:hypothetical protein
MKRAVIIEVTITNCLDCPYVKTIDGYSSHCYTCDITKDATSEIEYDDFGAMREMEEWFKNCPKWEEIK